MKRDRYVILHNVRSRHNVGSIFRTADGAGVTKIFLTGYTPAPRDRFGREVPEIQKTSLGAASMVPWEQRDDIVSVIKDLKEQGVSVVVVEQHLRSVDHHAYRNTDAPVAYIFGNEIDGVPEDVCEMADTVVAIPMLGQKESLNVSVCAGIILFR